MNREEHLLKESIDCLELYLNAGDKQSRAKCAVWAKQLYKRYHGKDYENAGEVTKAPLSEWWGYLHVNGGVQVKRRLLQDVRQDIADASESPFVERVTPLFFASDREDAIKKAKTILGI